MRVADRVGNVTTTSHVYQVASAPVPSMPDLGGRTGAFVVDGPKAAVGYGTSTAVAVYVARNGRPMSGQLVEVKRDGTTFGSGSHEKTGRHCQIDDPNGRLDVTKHAGYWLRDDTGKLTKKMRHICWDGCMFPNAVMEQQATWNKILGAMIKVRDAHGWRE